MADHSLDGGPFKQIRIVFDESSERLLALGQGKRQVKLGGASVYPHWCGFDTRKFQDWIRYVLENKHYLKQWVTP